MSMSKPVVMVTGGSGYLGSILVNKLLMAQSRRTSLNVWKNKLPFESNNVDMLDDPSHLIDLEKVIVYDNLMYRQTSLTDYCYRGDFEFVHGDVRNKTLLKKYVDEADIIIPLSAIVGFPACEKDPDLAWEVNYNQIEWILKNTSSDQKIIYPNTNSMYGTSKDVVTEESPSKPLSVYGITKTRAESLLLDSGRAITLRLATVFGVSPRMRLDLLVNDFTYKAVNDKYIVLFEKDFKRNYIHIQDVAMTFMYMMNNYDFFVGETFNVGLSNANLSKMELAENIKKYIPEFSIFHDDFANDPDKRDYIVSNAKLEATGWKPYYTLDDGIKELIQAYQIISHSNRMYTNL